VIDGSFLDHELSEASPYVHDIIDKEKDLQLKENNFNASKNITTKSMT